MEEEKAEEIQIYLVSIWEKIKSNKTENLFMTNFK